MQTLKPDIRQKILLHGEKLFARHGYEGTPMRDIADAAGITVSNLYKYFENKEALFEAIIHDYYTGFRKGLETALAHPPADEFSGRITDEITESLFRSISPDPSRFVLLFDRSEGTKYASFRSVFADMLASHMSRGGRDASHDFLFRVLAENFLRGLIAVASHYKSHDWARRNIADLVVYHLNGMKSLD